MTSTTIITPILSKMSYSQWYWGSTTTVWRSRRHWRTLAICWPRNCLQTLFTLQKL